MDKNRRRLIISISVIFFSAAGFALLTALLVNIFNRKQESKETYVRFVEVNEDTVDATEWGKNWPRQYDGYRRTGEPTRTKYGGGVSGEGEVPEQKAVKDPWLTRLFSGYLFSLDYRDRRGHAFMLHDQEVTKRNVPQEAKQSGNCLHCHASIMPLYRSKGSAALPNGTAEEQIQKGLEIVGSMNYWDAHKDLGALSKVEGKVGKPHPVSCVDCHQPSTMELRVTRPGFITGIQELAKSDVPTPHLPSIERWRKGPRTTPYNPNVDGTRQELRSYTCGQCHVEYFCGKGTTIFFPWQKGLQVEQIEASFNERKLPDGKRFKDWTHAETGMEVLKAQHPEFEVWSQGIHAKSGVSCADCHMPYKREGAMKVSEHWIKSPLTMVNRACQTCHPYPEEDLRSRVETIQDRHYALLSRAGAASVSMLDSIKSVRAPVTAKNASTALTAAKDKLSKDPAYLAMDEGAKKKKLESEIAAQQLTLWRALVERDPKLKEIEELQRGAQWRLDFVAAENSMGFHAPQELARILGESIDLSRQAQVKATEYLQKK